MVHFFVRVPRSIAEEREWAVHPRDLVVLHHCGTPVENIHGPAGTQKCKKCGVEVLYDKKVMLLVSAVAKGEVKGGFLSTLESKPWGAWDILERGGIPLQGKNGFLEENFVAISVAAFSGEKPHEVFLRPCEAS